MRTVWRFLFILFVGAWLPMTASTTLAGTAATGEWHSDERYNWSAVSFQAVHGILDKNGRILLFDLRQGTDVDTAVFVPDEGDPADGKLYTPLTFCPPEAVFGTAAIPQQHQFVGGDYPWYCSGHAQMADGRVLIAGGGGGAPGHRKAWIYDPDEWNNSNAILETDEIPDSEGGRWYPTLTTLASGKLLLTAGRQWPNGPTTITEQDWPCVYDPLAQTKWTRWSSQTSAYQALNYPFMFQLTNGKVFYAGGFWTEAHYPPSMLYDTISLNISLQSWSTNHGRAVDGEDNEYTCGSAVMYRPDRVLKGGAAHSSGGEPFHGLTFRINLADGTPAWTPGPEMNWGRQHQQFVLLPDGRVLAIGGAPLHYEVEEVDIGPINIVEWWNPDASESGWVELAAHHWPRHYHGVALLLPDGRVFSAGGEHGSGTVDRQHNAELFRPPYLFRDDDSYIQRCEREFIENCPDYIAYDSGFVITLDAELLTNDDVQQVALVRLGSATHHWDMDQRYVPLEFTRGDYQALYVAAPPNGQHAPPGYYMLFVMAELEDVERDDILVPSVARIVQIGPEIP